MLSLSILNFLLNDENREPFESTDDKRLEYILQVAEKVSNIIASKSRYIGHVNLLLICLAIPYCENYTQSVLQHELSKIFLCLRTEEL